VSKTMGDKSTPIPQHESALSRFFCSSLSLRNVAALPRSGRPVQDSGNVQVHLATPQPPSLICRMACTGAASCVGVPTTAFHVARSVYVTSAAKTAV